MSGDLRRNHQATPSQVRLAFGKLKKPQKPTQADVIVQLLREKRAQARALELPEIMAAGIAQHGARFNEIRARGFVIENELEHDAATGAVRSRYWLKFDPEREARNER